MLLFVGTKRSRRQYFAAWFASCAGHASNLEVREEFDE
jgi:hypothetical protein